MCNRTVICKNQFIAHFTDFDNKFRRKKEQHTKNKKYRSEYDKNEHVPPRILP